MSGAILGWVPIGAKWNPESQMRTGETGRMETWALKGRG